MFGMRCQECGEVRWSIIARNPPETECPACGAKMTAERRFPGRTRAQGGNERRDAGARAPNVKLT